MDDKELKYIGALNSSIVLAQAILDNPMVEYIGHSHCPYCDAEFDRTTWEAPHSPRCVTHLAKAVLERGANDE